MTNYKGNKIGTIMTEKLKANKIMSMENKKGNKISTIKTEKLKAN